MATLADDVIRSVFRKRVETGSHLTRNISRFTLALCDLMEAEGRDLRRSVMRTGTGLCLVMVGAVLLLLSFGFILRSLYLWMSASMSQPPALLVTGVITLCIAGVCGICAKKVSQT